MRGFMLGVPVAFLFKLFVVLNVCSFKGGGVSASPARSLFLQFMSMRLRLFPCRRARVRFVYIGIRKKDG